MPTALLLIGVLVVVFGLAALATRDSSALAPVEADRADLALPAGRVTAADLRGLRFGLALRGYRMREVDTVLDRLAEELADRDRRLAELGDPEALAAREAAEAQQPAAEHEPAEAQPADAQPAEIQPAEAQPAPAATPVPAVTPVADTAPASEGSAAVPVGPDGESTRSTS